MQRTRYKATLALVYSVLLLLIAYPQRENGFFWMLLSSGALAATVGGLADWFAVTAIFKKPLGIGWRTDILRRHRPRILKALTDYIAEDLLSVDNVMSVVVRHDLSGMLKAYLSVRGGREKLKRVVIAAAFRAAASMDKGETARAIAPVLREGLKSFPIERLLVRALANIERGGIGKEVLPKLIEVLRESIREPPVLEMLLAHVHNLRVAYEEGGTGRSLVLSMMELDDDAILMLLLTRLDYALEQASEGKGELYHTLEEAMARFASEAEQDALLLEVLSGWKESRMETADIVTPIERWLTRHMEGENPFWAAPLEQYFDAEIDRFLAEPARQQAADASVKRILAREFAEHHDLIREMIAGRLEAFSDDALLDFVETRVADDLQMIRINGAIVGAAAGVGLFLLTYIAGKVVGA
ncbi:DUF445 domain-containing protein [Selenomonas sp. TAMA-11512]|uniref:DUF445 family protein n=1 Tax=Selenomonas sp. TAMA-11512 TaxID=3095337 RepID=UPI0030938A57|nr:DUF445 domain-containing protein [Selenomonas sp. TAMA-11512]